MSHKITSKQYGVLLSSQIGEIPIAVDGTAVDVKLTGSGGRVVLEERYYAYGGAVTLYDLGSLIENDMRAVGSSYADYSLFLYDGSTLHDSHTLHVLYCDRYTPCTDVDTFLAENFLTTLQHRRVAPGDDLMFHFFATAAEQWQADIAIRWRTASDDTLQLHHSTLYSGKASANSVIQLDIEHTSLAALLASAYGLNARDIEIVGYTVNVGQRSLTAYVDPTLSAVRYSLFAFRNCFNVWEFAPLPATTTAKTEVERQTAVVNRTSSFYDQRVTKSYEVEVGPLTSDEAQWLDQLATSLEVMRWVPNACSDSDPWLVVPVLITDSEIEISDGDTPNSAKFTWRYADDRPLVTLSASPGIFTSPYTLPFS